MIQNDYEIGQTSCCAEEQPGSAENVIATSISAAEETQPNAETRPAAEERVQEAEPAPAPAAPAPEPPKEEAPAPKSPEDDGSPKVIACFKTEDGQEIDIVFKKRPWGIDFAKSVPMKVKNVHSNSVAEELGVKGGMAIIKVNGEVLPHDSPAAMEIIKKAVAKLP
eukprot:TRINITY_DN13320_c0_g1_i3.p1 TRINITY_DN13320_c0_g1~~TRINITY_DN13320_c0_g1_i3.p1  ORF type:complete len:166 (-),score=42.63 TRINITY_DN13320_c0_g1_i3:215-712(-)